MTAATGGQAAAAEAMDLSSILSALPSTSSASALPFDGPSLLSSLNSYGLATDLSPSDLSLTLPSTSSSSKTQQVSSSPSSNSTLSILLSRLSLLLSDLSRLLEAQIRQSLPALLAETSNVQGLQRGVWDLRKAIGEVDGSIQRIAEGTKGGVERLRRDQRRLKRLYQVNELVKLASRFVLLARRLEGNLKILFDEQQSQAVGEEEEEEAEEEENDDGDGGDNDDSQWQEAQPLQTRKKQHHRLREESLVRSARGINAIRNLLQDNPGLNSISFVASYQPSIASAKSQVLDTMERFIVLGLRDLSPSMLSSSLLTASMLGVLKDLVKDLMNDLTDVVRKRVEAAFASGSSFQQGDETLGSGAGYQSYKSKRPGVANTMVSSAQAQQELLARLETLFSLEMTAVCSKIYLLQRVLGLMRNTEIAAGQGGEEQQQGVAVETAERGTLLDEGIKILGDPPTLLFWRAFSSALASSSSSLPAHLTISASANLSSEVRRLVDLFFEKTSVWTGIGIEKAGAEGTGSSSAERVFVLRSMSL